MSRQTAEKNDINSRRRVKWGIQRPTKLCINFNGMEEGRERTKAVNDTKSTKESGGNVTKPESPLAQSPKMRPEGTREKA